MDTDGGRYTRISEVLYGVFIIYKKTACYSGGREFGDVSGERDNYFKYKQSNWREITRNPRAANWQQAEEKRKKVVIWRKIVMWFFTQCGLLKEYIYEMILCVVVEMRSS